MKHVRSVGVAARLALAIGLVTGAARSSLAQTEPPSPALTFTKDVAPIIFNHCAACHHPAGSAPFNLITYADVRQRATLIASVVKNRLMPPWKAEPGFGGEFIGQRPLTDDQVNVIQRWVGEGGVEGNPRDLPRLARWTPGWQLGVPDQVVTLSHPYVVKPDGGDILRIFVIRIPLAAARYVRGLEFRPGDPKIVHHANIRIDRTSRSRELDDQDPQPGYEGLMANSAEYPDGHFLGWTPGQVAPLLPKGLAWRLTPGTDLVVELHIQPSGRTESIQPSFGLFFTNDPPERTPSMLRLGSESIDIAAGVNDYTVTDSYELPVDVEIEAVQPHAHYRAREVKGIAMLPDGTTRWLIYIKDWDFRWQHVYRYAKPFLLPKGTTLSMRYTYDNSAENPRNPQVPPQRAQWGQQSFDEMGNLWIQVLTRDARDLDILYRSFRPKAAADDAAGYEMMIRRHPGNVAFHNDAALLYLELGRYDEALAHFSTAATLQPESAAAHFNVGTALMQAGRLDEAIDHYRTSLRLRPGYALAHINWGNALVAQGMPAEAVDHYRNAVRIDSKSPVGRNNLGQALLQLGNLDEATAHFREAIRLDGAYAEPHYNMSRVLRERGDASGAIAELRRAIQLKPDWPQALAELSQLLAMRR